jgi:hypothetical protein
VRPWTSWKDYFARDRGVARVADLVRRVIDHHRIANDLREARLFADWSELVGERIGSRTRPQSIWDRVLVVEVATSAWLHELRLLRPKIVSDLLDALGMPRFFDDIRFVLAKESPRRSAETIKPPVRRRQIRKPREIAPASAAAREQIVREAEKVEDPELRELIARVRIANDR